MAALLGFVLMGCGEDQAAELPSFTIVVSKQTMSAVCVPMASGFAEDDLSRFRFVSYLRDGRLAYRLAGTGERSAEGVPSFMLTVDVRSAMTLRVLGMQRIEVVNSQGELIASQAAMEGVQLPQGWHELVVRQSSDPEEDV